MEKKNRDLLQKLEKKISPKAFCIFKRIMIHGSSEEFITKILLLAIDDIETTEGVVDMYEKIQK